MKKLILLLSFVTLLSCSSSDDDSNNSNSSAFYQPPTWIQGTWGYKATSSQGISEQALYKFETDNVCQLAGISSMCWKETANLYKSTNAPNLVAEDTQTTSTYEAKFGASGSVITLKFVKISATHIKWVETGTGIDIILDKLK